MKSKNTVTKIWLTMTGVLIPLAIIVVFSFPVHALVRGAPKEKAKALLQHMIISAGDPELNQRIAELETNGFVAQDDYDAILLGATCRNSDCGWIYLVTTHFVRGGVYRSVGIVAKSWRRRGARLVRIADHTQMDIDSQ